MAKKFDVILGTGTVWNAEGKYVYDEHIQNHLRILGESSYYALRARNGPFRKNPDLFLKLSKHLTHIQTTPITNDTSCHLWKKES